MGLSDVEKIRKDFRAKKLLSHDYVYKKYEKGYFI